ncbi:hypothetical protein [Microbacterium sp. JZ31]|uniref:hypothetical protein n=1 Tax=Microbacterium sp. JZ31 TaxID=1906274 RepID=UPI001932F0B2|nr:hypothetical protein [Microbacterium sp. JZ31]
MGATSRTAGRARLLTGAAVALVLAVIAGLAIAWDGRIPPMSEPEVATPGEDQLKAASRARILFAHQSVGANILDGVKDVYASAGAPGPSIVETREPLAGDAHIAHVHVGVNGDPLGKIADFRALMSGPLGDAVDVALLKFCYDDITSGSDEEAVFDAYARAMAELERAHPDVTFLYTTVPLTTDRGLRASIKALLGRPDRAGPLDNAVRARYNELVRERYGDTGRLFDIAAVETTVDGAPTTRTLEAETYHVLNAAYAADNGHLNAVGARAAAGALIEVVAANVR